MANMWNALLADIVNSNSLNMFKNRLDDYWKEYRFVVDMQTIPFHRTCSQQHFYKLLVAVVSLGYTANVMIQLRALDLKYTLSHVY